MNEIIFVLTTVNNGTSSSASGGTISNSIIIEQTAELNIPVRVVCTDIDERYKEHLFAKGVKINFNSFPSSFLGIIRKQMWLLYSLYKLDKLGNIIVTSNSTSFYSPKHAKSMIICRAYEDFYSEGAGGIFYQRLSNIIKRELVRRSYRRADAIIANSKYMAAYISANMQVKLIHILYPPIDVKPERFTTSSTGVKTIGIVNPSLKKGEDIFLGLAKKFAHLRFIYFSKENKQYALNNVIFGGWQSDRSKIFASVDMMIVPSEWDEPFGRISPEAIRSGKPVLVSNRGGLPETVSSEFIVHTNEIEAWSNKLTWFINNYEVVEKYWHKSFLITEDFTSYRHFEKIKKLFLS